MRMGVFGGSFDPVHLGHLWIADTARESLNLSEVRWMPAARSPLKAHSPVASDEDRLQMIRLALAGDEKQVVDDREIRRGGISYTVDTMEGLRSDFPDAQIMMILGSDSLASMRQWHEPQRLLSIVIPAVVQRGGEEAIDFSVLEGLMDRDRIDACRASMIPMPLIELSSSELRQRVAEGRSIRYRTPRSVEAMITAQGIYQQET